MPHLQEALSAANKSYSVGEMKFGLNYYWHKPCDIIAKLIKIVPVYMAVRPLAVLGCVFVRWHLSAKQKDKMEFAHACA